MLLSCHRILVEAGDPRAGAVLEQARTYLRAMAEEVGDPDLAAGYLAYPPHAALLRRTELIRATGAAQQVANSTGPSYSAERTKPVFDLGRRSSTTSLPTAFDDSS